jgi:hypothetical protein
MPDAKTIDVSAKEVFAWVCGLEIGLFEHKGPEFSACANFVEALAVDRDRLAAENARLREALDPFARAARIIDAIPSEFRPEDDVGARDYLPRLWPDVGDLRRARAALGES